MRVSPFSKIRLNFWETLQFWKKWQHQAWFIRLTNKEYWDSRIFTVPIGFYVAYLALRARSPLFFTAANPAIPTGGMVGENKADISRWIPPQYRPKNGLIEPSDSVLEIRQKMDSVQLKFPVIIKPVVGCRGLMVKKVENLTEIANHLMRFPTQFLIEEFIDFPIEAAVLFWKNPETGAQGILSVAVKEFLSVEGTGVNCVESLLLKNPRAILQMPRLMREKPELLRKIPALGEKIIVEHIGNHCRGTKFLNYNHLITPEMVADFAKIQTDLPNCYVFRLDLKTPSVSDLQNGQNIKILEINGVGSDPAHIYDPKTPFFEMYGGYMRLWRKIFEVSTALNRRGVRYMKFSEYRVFMRRQKEAFGLEV